MSVLPGEGARMEFTGITFAGAGQDLDTGAKVVHAAPNTTSRSGIWCLTAWCNTSASMVCIHTRTDDSYED